MNRIIKRIFDFTLAFFLIFFLSPLLLGVVVVLFVLEGLPIFYVSKRMVSCERIISVPKFRSMVVDALSDKYSLNARFMKSGFLDIPLSCEVYTPIGRFLEYSQLVETPQIFLVLMGKLSFVGNRPLPPANVELLTESYGEDMVKLRFSSPAGMTGISQIAGKHYVTPFQRIDIESQYSLIYSDGKIILLDLFIIFGTIYTLFFRKNIELNLIYKILNYCKYK